MTERSLPIVPGCMALMLPSEHVWPNFLPLVGTIVRVIAFDQTNWVRTGRRCWEIDSDLARKLTAKLPIKGLSAFEVSLLRIDGDTGRVDEIAVDKPTKVAL